MSDVGRHVFPEGYEVREGISFPKNAAKSDFSYSDGDATENHLLHLISNAADRSLFSPEIRAGIRDWPSRYHLSSKRANLLRPFAPFLAKSVLEVGAGCGAVTRFLGENGGRIVAVEGNARRALIARRRTEDLTNVQIVCDRIENFLPLNPFDVVTAIGVLEYAARYNPDKNDPHLSLLLCLREFLTPQGVIILAIENRLGLKYFAGAREDHTGAAFGGINDSYRQGSVATFGAAELARLLDRSGLRSRVWFVPCPDYKLPGTVISTGLLNRHPELAATLMAQATLSDPQRPSDPTFSLEQGWSTLGRNALLGELANSFLVVAGVTAEAVAPYQRLEDLAWHFSVDRHPAFAKETRFTRADNEILVRRRALTKISRPNVPIRQILAPEPLRQGQNWWNRLADILNKPDWSASQVADWARVWTDALIRECGVPALTGEAFLKHVDGRFFDLAPFNMVRDSKGETYFFDQEWVLTPTVELGYLVVRGLRDSLLRVTSCAQPAVNTPYNVNQLIVSVLAELGILVTRAEIDRYALMEGQVQAWVKGQAASGMSTETAQAQWNVTLKQRSPSERDALVKERQTLQGQLEQTGQQFKQAEKARVQLTADLTTARATSDRQAGEIIRLTTAAKQQAGEISRLHNLRVENERRIKETDRELQAARDMLRDSQDQTQRLAGDLASAQDELARKVSEHEAERVRLAAMSKECDDRIAALGMDLHATHGRLRDSEAQIQSLIAERNAVQGELGRLHAVNKDRDGRIAELGHDLMAAQARLQDGEKQLRALSAERDNSLRDAVRAATERNAAARQVAQLFAEVGTLSKLKQQLETEKTRVKQAESEAARLRVGLEAARAALARREQEREAQARDVQAAKVHAEDLRAALERKTSELEALESKPFRFSPLAALRAAGRPFARWNRPDYQREADVIRKSCLFSALAYLKRYPDVAEAGEDPLLHYIRHGEAEGRVAHPLFDAGFYRRQYPDAAATNMTALAHYASAGVAAAYDPIPLFDTDWYLRQNPEVAAACTNPLHHYTTLGWREGRDPHPEFHAAFYLANNPDVAAAGENPLVHYVHHGQAEGRRTGPPV